MLRNCKRRNQEKYWVTWFDTKSKSFKALSIKVKVWINDEFKQAFS